MNIGHSFLNKLDYVNVDFYSVDSPAGLLYIQVSYFNGKVYGMLR